MQSAYGNRAVQRSMEQAWPSKYAGAYTPPAEEGIWEKTKKLLGVDQIGPGIEKIMGKAKSGYEWAEKKALGFFGGGDGGGSAPPENAPTSPGYNYSGGGVSNYQFHDAWPMKSSMWMPEADEEGF
jgi:hypothetical protein